MRIELRYVREYILANLPKHSKEARNDAIDNLDTRNHDSSNTESQGKETIEIENAAINAAIADRKTSISLSEMDSNEDNVVGNATGMDAESVKQLKVFKFVKSAINFINIFEFSNGAFESIIFCLQTKVMYRGTYILCLCKTFQIGVCSDRDQAGFISDVVKREYHRV